MNTNVTSDNEQLIALGLNPGIVNSHFNVSRTPIRFRKLEAMSWGNRYEAVHSCNLESSDGPEGVVDGFEFSVEKGKSVREEWERTWLYRDDC